MRTFALLFVVPWFFPQEKPQERVTVTAGGRKLEADWGESRLEPDGRRMTILTGRVELSLGDKATGSETIRADRAIAWSADSGADPLIKELYVEGNITFKRVDPKTKRETTFRAERLYVDFVNQKIVAIDLKARTWSERLKTPLILNAKEARSIAQGVLEAEDITITTCTFGDPDYKVMVARGTVKGEGAREKRQAYDLWPYDSWSVQGEGISAEVWGLPFFFFPAIALGSALHEFPLRSLKGGRTSRFGTYAYADWGVSISKGLVDGLNPWDASGSDDDKEKWGEILLETDWRQTRGLAGGLDLKYKRERYFGYIDTYFLRDEGPVSSNSFDQKFLPLIDHRRWRARSFNRFEVLSDWRLEIEVSKLSDRNLLEEFFEKEFKEGKEQETVAYVRWLHENFGGYVLERNRINNFQTQLEYLPRAHFLGSAIALAPDLVSFTGEVDASHLRLRPASEEPAAIQGDQTWRGDLLTGLSAAVDLWLISVSPFADVRTTYWQDDLNEQSQTRILTTAGARAVASVHGVHDVAWEFVGLRKLRHIMQIDAHYASTVSERIDDGAALFRYEQVDALTRFSEVAIEFRHRFQTKVQEQDRLVTHEFLDVGIEAEYYPDPARDTTAPNETNFASPFHWITLAPSDTGGTFSERKWSNLHWYLNLKPRAPFALTMAGEYNSVDSQEEAREISVTTRPMDSLSITAGEIFLKDVTTAFTGGIKWQITEKWAMDLSAQYDFELGSFLKRRAIVQRDFHDFLLEVVYEDDESRAERRFYVTLVPKLLKKAKDR